MKFPMTISMRPGHRLRRDIAYAGYYVNGDRLADTIDIGDSIPPFGWLDREQESRFARMILREEESDLHPHRVPLFICPECADYGCGVTTCAIDREDDFIVWRDFATENNYSDERYPLDLGYPLVLKFDATEYRTTFAKFL